MYDAGVHYIKDLFYQNKFMRQEMIKEMYSLNVTEMRYNSLLTAIPKEWKRYMENEFDEEVE